MTCLRHSQACQHFTTNLLETAQVACLNMVNTHRPYVLKQSMHDSTNVSRSLSCPTELYQLASTPSTVVSAI
jgi:hypothetical protein